ncbi:MAG: hypothetical protein BRC28_03135 [Nanohaloarchaea archaeon SW_4_43_9]|nr:MAG: hypothetical protein BRC28_03135 [Nanohaloarchaea archaeon SW_4_43_9]
MDSLKVKAGGKVFEADLADSFLSRAKGLSFSSDKEVIEVQKAEPWSWSPRTWSLYYPGQKYSYLLESFENLGIEEGDRIEF